MKNQQRARITLRERYRQLAILFLQKERTKILDIQTLQELIEMELGRPVKKDELIAAFERKDNGLEVATREEITWVIFHKPEKKTAERKAPKKAMAPAKPRKKAATPKEVEAKKFSPSEFTLRAIRDLRKPPHKGIHSVFSGFNAAFRIYFPDLDPVQTVIELAEKNIIVSKKTRGGALLYVPIPGKIPEEKDAGKEALKKMSLA